MAIPALAVRLEKFRASVKGVHRNCRCSRRRECGCFWFIKNAIDDADFEQQVGGVETLFGEARQVIENVQRL